MSEIDYAAWLKAAARSAHCCYAMGSTIDEGRRLLEGAASEIDRLRAKLAAAEER